MMLPQQSIHGSPLRYILIVIVLICMAYLLPTWSSSNSSLNNRGMGIVHIVLFEFKSGAKPEDVQDVSMAIR